MVFKKLLTDGQLHSATVRNPSKKKSAMDPIGIVRWPIYHFIVLKCKLSLITSLLKCVVLSLYIVVGGLSLNSREQSSSSPSNSKRTDIVAPIINVTSPNMATSTSALATAFVLTLQQASGPSASLSSVQIEAQLKTNGGAGQVFIYWDGREYTDSFYKNYRVYL